MKQGTAWGIRRKARARAILDFEAAGSAPEEALRQAPPAAITLKAAPARAPTLLPEDLHYEASVHARRAWAVYRSIWQFEVSDRELLPSERYSDALY